MKARAAMTGPMMSKKPKADPSPTMTAAVGLTNIAIMEGTWDAKVAEKGVYKLLGSHRKLSV